jgi:hypothetical protein
LEPPLNKPIIARYLIPPPPNAGPEPSKPIIGPGGEEYFRLSDIRAQIEVELRKEEEKVHETFMKRLTAYLAESWDHKLAEDQRGACPETDMPREMPRYIW